MSDQAAVLDSADYRTSPTARDVFENWKSQNADRLPVHDQRWDVGNPDIYHDDNWQPIFKEMRAEGPVNKVTGTPFGDYWNVTTIKAIQHVESLPKIFSSDWQNGGITILDMDIAEDEARAAANFLSMDPPEHSPRRRTVAPAFTPAEMVRLTDLVRERTCAVLDSLPIGEEFDWVQRVSIELTTGMLATIFDFPWHHRKALSFWSDWLSEIGLGQSQELSAMRMEVIMEMAGCFHKLWEQRLSAEETPDLLSRMIHSDAMNKMDPMEFMSNMALLIVGGNDTTRNTMTGIIEALDCFPEQRAKLEEDPGLIPNAVQECIRYVTPVAHMRRTAMEDYELDGQLIRKGDKVILWYISGNRDETVFDEADRLIVTRPNARRHIAFGYGIHRCIGARLAEMQLRILIEEMVARRMRVHVTGEVERLRQNFIHGFSSAKVTVERG
ncbi:MAG: cytochrome P450 [Sphingomonadaceae bacterium]|nr:cytochrome P450 [Sphingomonadaceae bacterium]